MLSLVFLCPSFICAEVLPLGQTSGWQLIFQDDFEGTALDNTKWAPQDLWCGIRNNELQAYRPENARVSGGLLHLVAEKRSANLGYCGQPTISKSYASGIVITMDKFDQQYGYFEARIKVPKGNGLWPAFWMMPYHTWPPEIDIMEILGRDTDTMYMTNHWGTASSPQKKESSFSGIDFSADFHVFGAKWTSSDITWYVDGVQRFNSTSGIPSQPFFMMLNLAVGGNWPGSPDSSTYFPSEMQVDYVRAWQPVNCSSNCVSAGQKRCDGDAVQVCELSAGCLKWTAAIACGSGQVCESGICVDTCIPKTCSGIGYGCGAVSDGCGNMLDCGTCPAGNTCANGNCIADCIPKTCASLGNYGCGLWRDGCGKTINCGVCSASQNCVYGKCQTTCVAKTCASLGNYQCGDWRDGCGKTIDCGNCFSGQNCLAGKCVASCASHAAKKCYGGNLYWYNSCNVKEELAQSCGVDELTDNYQCASTWIQRQTLKKGCANNGCYKSSQWFNVSNCAPSGKICANGVCAANCQRSSCANLGYACGNTNDGCGKILNCGACASGKICKDGRCVFGGSPEGDSDQIVIVDPEKEVPQNLTRAEILEKIADLQKLLIKLMAQLIDQLQNQQAAMLKKN